MKDSDAQELIRFPFAPPLTRFVGRNDELEELRAVFREGGRLVTMTGIGGIGKTRLAVNLFPVPLNSTGRMPTLFRLRL